MAQTESTFPPAVKAAVGGLSSYFRISYITLIQMLCHSHMAAFLHYPPTLSFSLSESESLLITQKPTCFIQGSM